MRSALDQSENFHPSVCLPLPERCSPALTAAAACRLADKEGERGGLDLEIDIRRLAGDEGTEGGNVFKSGAISTRGADNVLKIDVRGRGVVQPTKMYKDPEVKQPCQSWTAFVCHQTCSCSGPNRWRKLVYGFAQPPLTTIKPRISMIFCHSSQQTAMMGRSHAIATVFRGQHV